MKTNSKRKVFGDAVDLLMGDMEEVTMPRGVQMVPVKSIHPFHDHPFHLYEGERLEDMIASVKEHGVLNPVIVQKLDTGYEMLSGHNRWNAAKLAGIKEIPAIVKTDLSEEEAYVYVIETNLMQRSFSDLAISEKAAVLKARYEKGSCQGKRNDILNEIARLEGKSSDVTSGHCDQKLTTRDKSEHRMTPKTLENSHFWQKGSTFMARPSLAEKDILNPSEAIEYFVLSRRKFYDLLNNTDGEDFLA